MSALDAGLQPRPTVAEPTPWAFPEPVEHTASNGVRVLAYDMPGQHVISLRLVIPLSLRDEPEDKEGIAAMVARLLDEGTRHRSSDEFAEAMERIGMVLGAGVTDGALSVDVDVPARFVGPALELLTEALAEPDFPEPEVRRILRTRLAEIEHENVSPPHLAQRHLATALWSSRDRASRPAAGSPATIEAIDREDLAAFHRSRVGPAGATLAIAGDLGGIEIVALIADTIAGWVNPEQVAASQILPPVAAAIDQRVLLIDRPGSVQSELVVAVPGPDRGVAQGWAPYPVASFVMGGSPGARVDAVLREEKGYTYGMRSAFRPRVLGGVFATTGSVRV